MPNRKRSTRDRASVSRSAMAMVVVTVGSALACSTWSSGRDESAAEDPLVATVDGNEIHLAKVDARIRQELFDREFGDDADSLYEARRMTVDELVDERLLADAAASAGMTTDAYLDSALGALPPITDEEVQQVFDKNRDRLPAEATIDEYDSQLRSYIIDQRIAQVFARLREGSNIQIHVPRNRVEVAASGPGLGPIDAPMVIVAFSDFQCPFCARAAPTLQILHERHPDDLRIVYRHMPLSFHGQARLAAIGAVCADSQGRFWDYHDALFADQNALERNDLIAHATTLGLDADAFATCLDDPSSAAVVDMDAADAEALGVTGTPTFFVNGLKLTGARPVEHFEAVLVEESTRVAP